jgi:shikimate kinase
VRAVFLVGFMGAGKTRVGGALSEYVGWAFEDLDDRIQKREGRTVAEIFASSGEAAFRKSELAALRELLAELQSGPPLIVALGGGAFVGQEAAALLEQSDVVTVFLDAPAEELWQRCGADPVDRPLRREEAEFRQLYATRRPRYLMARMRVDTASRTIDAIVHEIADRLGLPERVSGEEK